MTEGVAQGDPNSQSLFVMAYEEFGQQVDEIRADTIQMDFKIPKYLIPQAEWCPLDTISMHQHVYTDDHAEIHTIKEPTEIQKLITTILESQRQWGMATNMDKSFALVKLQGKGCRKKLKNMANKIQLGKYGSIKVVESNKYLGAYITADAKMNDEVTSRIKQATAQDLEESRTLQTNEKQH